MFEEELKIYFQKQLVKTFDETPLYNWRTIHSDLPIIEPIDKENLWKIEIR